MNPVISKIIKSILIPAILILTPPTFSFIVGYIPSLRNHIEELILAIIVGFVLYFVTEKRKTKSEISNSFNKIIENTKTIEEKIDSYSQLQITKYDSKQAFQVMSDHFLNTKKSIDQIALTNTPDRVKDILPTYLSSMKKAATNTDITYRFICGKNYQEREDRMLNLRNSPDVNDFHLKFLNYRNKNDDPHTIPMMNFVIFDNKKVLFRYPNVPDQKEIYLMTSHPDTIELFSKYFENLWREAKNHDEIK